MKEKLIALRLPFEIEREIGKIACLEDTNKSKLLRELIIFGLRERKIKQALKLYSEGKITLWKASKLSDISIWKMLDILKQKRVQLQYGERELKEDLKALKE